MTLAAKLFRHLRWIPLFFLPVLTACGSGGDSALDLLEVHGQTMGTTYSVKVVDAPAPLDAKRLKGELDEELLRINQAMSTYIKDSELSIFNRSEPGPWQPVSDMLMVVLGEARRIFDLSGGAFDPSVGPLVNLWGFGPDMQTDFPSDEAVQAARAQMGFDQLEQDAESSALRKPHAMYIDLSAIAKGYAVERLTQLLAGKELVNYLVEIGGELRAEGVNAERQPWRIAIEKPDPGQRAVHGIVRVSGMGMATSGDYRNFFEKAGRRYSHTIDPRTGYPVTHSLVSVTVLADKCMTADALATAFMVMGAEAAYDLAEREQIAAWFVEHSDGVLTDRLTPKMQNYRLH